MQKPGEGFFTTNLAHKPFLILTTLLVITASVQAENLVPFDLKKVPTDPNVVTRIYGSVGSGHRGVPVAAGHDCDNDGFVDMAFASIQASPLGRFGAGEVTLVFGNGQIGGTIDTAGFSGDILKIAGVQLIEVAGAEIWMDDVTGDGIGDLLIGRQNYTPQSGREGAGALTILIGSTELRNHAATLAYLDLQSLPASIKHITFLGVDAYDRLGIWFRTGDITGDGIADMVIGSDEVDSPTETNRGVVYVIRGGPHLTTTPVIDLADFGATSLVGHIARLHPPAGSDNYHLGATCQIADLDNNGRGDILVAAALNRSGAALRLLGAPPGTGQSSGGSENGTLYIAWDDNFPDTVWPSGYEFELSAPTMGTTSTIEGATFNRSFGEEILGGLDYNGDAKADLFVGDLVGDGGNGVASGVGFVFFDASQLKGKNINLDNPPTELQYSLILGPRAGAIGADTVTHGDYDLDGFADLAIGNPHDQPLGRVSAGTMHILFGQPQGWPEVIDLSDAGLENLTQMRIAPIYGAKGTTTGDTGDTLCYSAAAGDIDNDGYIDLIVNEMVGNGLAPSAIDVGNMLIISGAGLVNLVTPVMVYVDSVATGVQNGRDRENAFTTIQAGIDAAKDGDTVLVFSGRYQEGINFNGKEITVESAADAAVIDCNDQLAGVVFDSGESAKSVLRNFVITRCTIGLLCSSSSPTIEHVTVVNNAIGVRTFGSVETTIRNSIFWYNSQNDLVDTQAVYCCIERFMSGAGNISTDPLFGDPNNGDYHLRSQSGRFVPLEPANTTQGLWTLDDSATSPCVDTADPSIVPVAERQPHGGRLNMGAYGNTAFASLSQNWRLSGDLNRDGIVDLFDFEVITNSWLATLDWF